MACLNMVSNNEQQGFSMGPRISFSNDFGDTQQAIKHENSYREAPVSSDFEFSVPTYSANSADEIFFKGKLLPLKENKVMTLRDELLAHDNEDHFLPRLPKNSGWWKEKFGLRRSHSGSNKKSDKNVGGLQTIDESRKPVFVNEVYANFTGAN